MKTIAFLNNKGGVGKTTLVYHLAWMFQELGLNVLAADLDAQSNLSAAFLSEERLAELWEEEEHPPTILGVIKPLLERAGDIADPIVEPVAENLFLLAGDVRLNLFEERLAAGWISCLDDNLSNARDGFKVTTAFYRGIEKAAENCGAEIALIDVAPNLGVINRAALVAADFVFVPLAADLFSLQDLKNLGPALKNWRSGWTKRKGQLPEGMPTPIPEGRMEPIGYVIMQPVIRKKYPVRASPSWINRISSMYASKMLDQADGDRIAENDPNMPAILKNYRSLMPLALEAGKPMFHLKPADGAIGGYAAAVLDCRRDFEKLARAIARACRINVPKHEPVSF